MMDKAGVKGSRLGSGNDFHTTVLIQLNIEIEVGFWLGPFESTHQQSCPLGFTPSSKDALANPLDTARNRQLILEGDVPDHAGMPNC